MADTWDAHGARDMMSFKVDAGDPQRFREIALRLGIKRQRRVTQGEILHMALDALERELSKS